MCVRLAFKMLRRWPELFIQAVITCAGDRWPHAMFSAQARIENPVRAIRTPGFEPSVPVWLSCVRQSRLNWSAAWARAAWQLALQAHRGDAACCTLSVYQAQNHLYIVRHDGPPGGGGLSRSARCSPVLRTAETEMPSSRATTLPAEFAAKNVPAASATPSPIDRTTPTLCRRRGIHEGVHSRRAVSPSGGPPAAEEKLRALPEAMLVTSAFALST